MNVVVASSRGFDIQEHLPEGTISESKAGGKLIKTLTPLAKSLTPYANQHYKRPHIYFVCGIPDITELIKSPENSPYHYREVIFVEEPSICIKRYQNDLETCQREILRHGALPIFATIPQYSIEIYNNHILTCKHPKTSHLHHNLDYKTMQTNMVETIDSINGIISRMNKTVGASTPFLHHTVKEYRGKKGSRYYVYRYDRYRDGLHAGENLAKKWADSLGNAFVLNQRRDISEDEGSPKRSWKKCRKF